MVFGVVVLLGHSEREGDGGREEMGDLQAVTVRAGTASTRRISQELKYSTVLLLRNDEPDDFQTDTFCVIWILYLDTRTAPWKVGPAAVDEFFMSLIV
jgi:hypothetical protein